MVGVPPGAGLCYFGYREGHSIVLIAVVNSNYQVDMVDGSDVGPQSHGRVFSASNIAGALDEGLLNIPPPRCLYGEIELFPFVLISDEGYNFTKINAPPCMFFTFFKLYKICNAPDLIKPYARASIKGKEQITNYRIS